MCSGGGVNSGTMIKEISGMKINLPKGSPLVKDSGSSQVNSSSLRKKRNEIDYGAHRSIEGSTEGHER